MADETTSLNCTQPLFPPRDFVPTSMVWGCWVAGVMAAINLARLGRRGAAWRLIGPSLVAQGLIWSLYYALKSATVGRGALVVVRPSTMQIHLQWQWLLSLAILLALNGTVGYWLYRSQRDAYRCWAEKCTEAMRKSPYVAWWVALAAIGGALVVVLLVALI